MTMTTEAAAGSADTSARVRTLRPQGAFDLTQSIGFGFGQRDAGRDGVMRLGFVTDDLTRQVGVAVTQDGGSLQLEVTGEGDLDAIARQTARILSVDIDATGWDALGRTDPLIGRLQRARPGLRPPLFHSAYEATAWSVLSARRPHQQMAEVRRQLSLRHGASVVVAGEQVPVFPTPGQLVELADFDLLPEVKMRRLRGVATAALDGRLDTESLRALPVDEAETLLRELDGIGPFYAQLVTVRALGHTDVAPTAEPMVLAEAGRLLGRDNPLTGPEFLEVAQRWSPWRTWASVAIRAAGPLVR
jgi:DNA-3-methyladenine glycosylase II